MTTSIRYKMLACLPLILLITACAKVDDYPSLAKRPFETGGVDIGHAPAVSAPAIASDTALPARLAGIVARARGGEAAFTSEYSIAERLVTAASGSSPGSDAWVGAQLAITRLEPLRSPAQSELVAMDDESRKLISGVSDTDQARIEAARATVLQISEAQTAQVQRLIARLKTR
jgi:hypothetical protein